jgi:hypothetical protein
MGNFTSSAAKLRLSPEGAGVGAPAKVPSVQDSVRGHAKVPRAAEVLRVPESLCLAG